MKICSYNPEDKDEIKKFVSKNLEEIFHSPAKGLEDLDNIDKNFELFLIAKEKKEIIGTIGVKKEYNCARISRMYTRKAKRGKGIGKALMKKALEYCTGKFDRVFLTTYKQMGSAGFYEKMSFKVFKKEGDVIWMEMFLTSD
jgi:GNAT superfamily N-acetyltransferase